MGTLDTAGRRVRMTAVTASSPIRTALVLGGGSDIGLAIVRRLAREGLAHVVLAARDGDRLRSALADDPIPIDAVDIEPWDALETGATAALLRRTRELVGDIDVVVCAVGSLGHHSGVSMSSGAADALIRTNFAGPAAALLDVARALVEQGSGTIVVLSSVAGARARRSNFVYGSAKAGLDAFSQGLGDAVAGQGVQVLVVRPGFVRSKMTVGLDPAPFASTPDQVAEAVVGALRSRRSRIVWVPARLGPLFAVFRNLPAPLWRRIASDR